MEALFLIFGLVFVGLWLIWRSLPIFSKPWRVKVVKDEKYTNTVKVILQKRWTVETGYRNQNIMEIKDGIVVNTDDPKEFKLRLKAAVDQAEEYAKVLRDAKKAEQKFKLPRLKKDKTP